MDTSPSDRKILGLGSWIFSLFAVVFAFAALVLAAQAWTRSNDSKDAVGKLVAGGLLGQQMNVRLQEYSMVARPTAVKSGPVHFQIRNNGTVTHEMVLVRAPTADALAKVSPATAQAEAADPEAEARAVGDVDEEAIPESEKPGEAEVKKGATVNKTIDLKPGTYVMFCNIDTKLPDGTVLNHFQHGMSAVITAG
jgi:uncharacterized cupredoxin-like copper-binding protein